MPINVLIIDDDPITIEFMTNLLQEHRFEVLTASSARRGVQVTREHFVDSIILDWSMMGTEEYDFFSSIRHFSYIPVLVLSTLDQPGMIARALDAGADDYLVKPVPSDILLAHLNKMIRWTEMNGWKFTGPQAAQNTA